MRSENLLHNPEQHGRSHERNTKLNNGGCDKPGAGTTARGALAAMATGFACVPLFKFVAPALPGVGDALAKLSELPPAFAASLLAGVVVSLLDRKGRAALRDTEQELREAAGPSPGRG